MLIIILNYLLLIDFLIEGYVPGSINTLKVLTAFPLLFVDISFEDNLAFPKAISSPFKVIIATVSPSLISESSLEIPGKARSAP